MKNVISFLLVLMYSISSFAQVTRSDMKEFGQLLEIKMYTSPVITALVIGQMHSEFPNHTEIELRADAEKIGYNINMFDNFCYNLISGHPHNKEYGHAVLYGCCGDASLAIKIYDYINVKFKNQLDYKLSALLAAQDEADKKKEIEQKKERELAERDEQNRKYHEEELAKEKLAKEIEQNKIIHEIKQKTYALNNFPQYYESFNHKLNVCILDSIYDLIKNNDPFPTLDEVNKMDSKSWILNNSYEVHFKMINHDPSDDTFDNVSTIVEKKLINGTDTSFNLLLCGIDLPLISYKETELTTTVLSEAVFTINLSLIKKIGKITTNGYKAEFSKNKPEDDTTEKYLIKEFFRKVGNGLMPGESKTFKVIYELLLVNGDVHVIDFNIDKSSSNKFLESIKSGLKDVI
jgi:hypothetical protein